MGDYSTSSLRAFYICRDRRFVTIPANINILITNCVINRLMSILFSFQSRNFIKLNKSKPKRITLLFFFTCYIENLLNFSITLSHNSM